ncbi:MAG: DNA polymerase III subunit gamma/tau [Pseudomonadota bacterium]
MSYQVLARKLRPAVFSELIGQDHVVRALTHALDTGRVHHAYLFTGTRGVGKTTIARILAKSLNCEAGVSSTPCGVCSICIEVKENRFVDLIEVDAASRTGVDDTRDLLDNAQYLPSRGRYKVYLIDEVHMLSAASFNALLKTLEEPPEHVKFLLATTDPKKVPVTVLSRCLQFQLKNLSRDHIANYLSDVLSAEAIPFEAGALEVIGRNAAGSMRDALSLTDQAIAYGQGSVQQADVVQMLGAVARNEVEALLEALRDGATQTLMQHSAELAERNADFGYVLSNLLEAFHEMAVGVSLRGAEKGANGAQDERYGFGAEELQLYYQIALLGHRDLALAPEPRTGFEMTLLRMLAFAPQASSVPARTESPGASTSASGGAAIQQAVGNPASAPEARSRSATPPAGVPSAPPLAKADVAPAEAVDKTTSVVEQAVATPVPAEEDHGRAQQWRELVDDMRIAGVTKMIADHSVMLSLQDGCLRLLLDASHDTLLSDAQTQTLERALLEAGTQDGTRVAKLVFEVGHPAWETPAQIRAREARERQDMAEQAIESDSTVKNLLAEFDGQIQQVRPLS